MDVRGGSQGRADTGTERGAATMLEDLLQDLLQEQGGPGHAQGDQSDEGRDRRGPERDGGPDR